MSFLDDLPSSSTTPSTTSTISRLTGSVGGDQHALSSSVSSPEHQGSGRTRMTDFLVTTTFANQSESLVRRTWEDFEWTQERLVEERAGIIVPVLPASKPAKQKFDDDFCQGRQAALDRFMQRVVGHAELVDAPSLLPFFTASPTDWKATKEAAVLAKLEADAAREKAANHSSVNDTEGDPNTVVISAEEKLAPPKKQGVFGKWMSAKRMGWALRNKNLILEETPVESKKFDDLQNYSEHLETCIRILAEDAKVLGKSQQEQSATLKTMGAAFTQLWGEHELSNTSSSTMYQTIGDCWTSVCKQIEDHSLFGQRQLETPFDELVLDVVALKEALVKRKKVVYEYTKKVQAGRKMQQQMDKLRGTTSLNEASDAYFALEREIRVTDIQVAEDKKFKELVTDRLSRDVERFRVEWHERMRELLERYHQRQVETLKDQQDLWGGSLPCLAQIDDGRSALPTGAKKATGLEMKVSYNTSGGSVSFGNDNSSGVTMAASPISYPVAQATVPPIPFPLPGPTSSFDSVVLDDYAPMGGVALAAAPPAAAPPIPYEEESAPKITSV